MQRQRWRVKVPLLLGAGGVIIGAVSLTAWAGYLPMPELFAMTIEGNLPTWYTSTSMLLVVLAAAVAGALSRSARPGLRWRWWIFAASFAALSLDEAAGLHERLEPIGARLAEPTGILHFVWVVPGFFLGACLVVVVAQLAFSLTPAARNTLIFGILLYLTAVLGLEMVGGVVLEAYNGLSPAYEYVATTEEVLEIIGVCIILGACLTALEIHREDDAVVLRYAHALRERGRGPRRRDRARRYLDHGAGEQAPAPRRAVAFDPDDAAPSR